MNNALRTLYTFLAVAALAISAQAGSVSVSSPTAGATVSSPFTVKATASSTNRITGWKVYVDGVSKYSSTSASISASISATTGTHAMTVKAWDSTGASFTKAMNVTVSTGAATPINPPTLNIPSTAKAFSKIEDMTGWDDCTVCAGGGANATYSITQKQSSPSLDGSATKIFLGGSTPFSHALMWRRMASSTSATNFVFDMYYQHDNPAGSQGVEFAANQSLSSGWYKFSTQCSYSKNEWRVWDSKNKGWVGTGIACSRPAARTWRHVTFEYQRSGGKAVFVAITVDGVRHYVNKSFYPQAKSGDGSIGIHFQVNGDTSQTDYTTWMDKLSFYYW